MRVSARKKRADFTAGHEATVVYPHQLFQENPALAVDRPVILAEDPWFFKRFRFHAQKLVLHRASMRRYRDHLAARGFRVEYIEAADLDTSTDLIVQLARKGISEIHLCDPLETGLIEEIEKACSMQGIRLESAGRLIPLTAALCQRISPYLLSGILLRTSMYLKRSAM